MNRWAGLTGAGILALALGTGAAAGETYAVPKKSPASARAWNLIKGDWIKKDFVEAVRRRRSVLAAVKAAGGMAFDTQEQKTLTFQFYDEYESRWVHRRAKALEVDVIGVDGDVIKLKIDDDDFPKSARVLKKGKVAQEIELSGAVYVRETKAWLAKAVIAGDYRDEKGEAFSFGADGRASWPGRKFRYAVATQDFEGMENDYFKVLTSPPAAKLEAFCFRWEGESLAILPVVPKEGFGACGSRPVHRLARAKAEGGKR
ncbi:MAG: hypothetical protein HY748_17350 [Elusimicrobia bacterium]|nr:hypothetical protein [Elusimicrobiota bacterium]